MKFRDNLIILVRPLPPPTPNGEKEQVPIYYYLNGTYTFFKHIIGKKMILFR